MNGPKTHAVYRFLRRNSELFNKKENTSKLIPWNFSKFLLNRKGQVVKFFMPSDQIEDIRAEVLKLIQWEKKNTSEWSANCKLQMFGLKNDVLFNPLHISSILALGKLSNDINHQFSSYSESSPTLLPPLIIVLSFIFSFGSVTIPAWANLTANSKVTNSSPERP